MFLHTHTHTKLSTECISLSFQAVLKFIHTAPSPDLVHVTDYILI